MENDSDERADRSDLATVLVIMVDVPLSLRTLPEETLMDFVRYVGGDTEHDVEAKYGTTLSNFKLTMIGHTGLQFRWETYAEISEVTEISSFLRDHWDYHSRRALFTLVQSYPVNNELKKDIDKIDARVVNNQGVECYERGEYDRAIDFHRRAISLHPDDSTFYNNLGVTLSMKGKHDEAVQNLKLALRINPRNEQARQNLSAVIPRGLIVSGRNVMAFCPFPECDASISVHVPSLGGRATARCVTCDSAHLVVSDGRVEEVGIYKYVGGPDFPQILPAGLMNDLQSIESGLWLLEDGHVLLKTGRPDYMREYDCIFEIELYNLREGVMPVVRGVLVIMDHPKNPSVHGCLCNISSPRVVANLRYLKTITKINLHIYDSQNQYVFTKEVPVAEAAPSNTNGPVNPPLMQVQTQRNTWPQYVETIIETAKSMYRSLPPELVDFKQASAEFNNCPTACVCEICGRQALTTLSQFRGGGHIDIARLKTMDAIQCSGCNIVLCMGCALKRMKTDEQGQLITPLSCSICGKPFSAF